MSFYGNLTKNIYEIEIYTECGLKIIESAFSDIITVQDKKGNKFKVYIRNREGGGKSGNLSKHQVTIKVKTPVEIVGSSGVPISIPRDLNKEPYIEDKIKNKDEIERKCKAVKSFAYKNNKLLIDIWDCTDINECIQLINKLDKKG